jgi:hypothetical protein
VTGVVAFLLTGQYMDLAHDHLRGMDDARRLLFRSTHIYLLFAALLNLALGLHLTTAAGWRRWPQAAGSALILAAPVLALAGFCTEPWQSGLDRPYTRVVVYATFGGVILHALGRIPGRRESPDRPPP